jgi:hypothetical protein
MSERGVFAVDRGIWDHDVLSDNEPYSRREAWLWLVSEAAWKPHKRRITGRNIELDRGQYVGSLRYIASKWRWNEARVRRFLSALISAEMVDAKTDAGVTVLTIRKYSEYQRVSLPSDAMRKEDDDAGSTQVRRKVEDREYKEIHEAKASGRKRATRLPSDAEPSDRNLADAAAIGLKPPEIEQQWRRMRDWSVSAPKGACLDWDARWRNWCETYIGGRNEYAISKPRTFGTTGPAATGADAILAGMGRIADRIAARKLAERKDGLDLACEPDAGGERA